MEDPADLAGITRGEIRLDGERSRISVPIGSGNDRYGAISFAKNDGLVHSAADLALAQELGDRLAMAIRNVREHRRLIDALGDRERLISIAAHELRGPLCSVRLCLQSLQRSRVPLAPKATRMVEIMIKEERRVARLIDDLLDLGRIRSGQLEMELSSVDLCEVVRDVSAQMQVQVAGSKLNGRAARSGDGMLGPLAPQSGRDEPRWQRGQVRTGPSGRHSRRRRHAARECAAGGDRQRARYPPRTSRRESSSRSNALSQRVSRTDWVSGCTSFAASFSNSAGR